MAGIHLASNSIQCLCAINNNTWILDSWASEQLCSNSSILHDICLLEQPMMVNLTTGTRVKVSYQGKLEIAPGLTLNHVLLVPHLKFNLLSIKKLCEQQKCKVEFIETLCIIHAPFLRRSVAISRDFLPLYVLDKTKIQA